AFSSFMFDLDDVAHEVLRLEERIDDLLYSLYMKVLMASETAYDVERLTPLLVIASAMSSIADAAGDLAKIFLKGFKLHPIVYESLKEVEERVVSTRIRKESKLVGKRIADISEELGAPVTPLIVCRGRRRLITPPEDLVIEPGDIIIVRANREVAEKLEEL
ncbi:MAG: TrkA C-terminal domain-containing protein, partial [Candidatus Nezhaarchaeales archaeon]